MNSRLLLAAIALTAFAQSDKPAPAPALASLRKAAEKLRPLMQKKSAPEPGDWLAKYPEPGQTFGQYLSSRPNRPEGRRNTLYILPIGEFTKAQEKLVESTAEMMGIVFGLPVKTLAPLADATIPASARRTHPSWGMKQFLSTYILDDVLTPRRPVDAVAMLGLTVTDLFPDPSWNFVFGQASLRERVGVWSLARYGDVEKDPAIVLRRTLQVATHETGHMFGIHHCTLHECGMNGSNSLPESDKAPLAFCSECELKLWWACGLDPLPRYEKLVDFAKSNGLEAERAEWQRRLEALSRK